MSTGPTHLDRVLAKPVDMLDGTGSFLCVVMAKDLVLPPPLQASGRLAALPWAAAGWEAAAGDGARWRVRMQLGLFRSPG